MRRLLYIALTFATAVLINGSLSANILGAQQLSKPTDKLQLIRRVLELTKAADVAIASVDAGIQMQRIANPRVPQDFWNDLSQRARKEAPRFVESLVAIYDSQFSEEQLRELIRFYQTPIGKYLIQVQPTIAAQSMRAAQQWGSELGSQVAQDYARRSSEASRH